MDRDPIEELLAGAVASYRLLPETISVGTAIEAVTGRQVLPMMGDAGDRALLEGLRAAGNILVARSQTAAIRTSRLNELGNAIEEPLLQACLDAGLRATWPRRLNGSAGRSGYPDIALDIDGERPAYLEAKVVGAGSEGSSFRSFYLSPSDNPKVCVDARHLLMAFTHRRRENASDGLEQYALDRFKIVDLYRVSGKIKFEYQSSNRDMYGGDTVIAEG